MPHRVHKRKKVVEVNGDVDLSAIWRKVEAHGGPEGWTLRTFITRDDIQQIASMIALGEDEDDAAEGSELPYRPIGFRVPAEPGITTGLPYHDLHEPDEDTDRDGATPKVT